MTDKSLNFFVSHGPCGKSQVSVCITKNLFRFQSTSKKYYRRLPELAPKRSFISDNSQKFDSNDHQLISETQNNSEKVSKIPQKVAMIHTVPDMYSYLLFARFRPGTSGVRFRQFRGNLFQNTSKFFKQIFQIMRNSGYDVFVEFFST